MTSSPNFPEALRQGVLVFDGAMGTEIYRHHVFTNRCYDELCLSDPELIRTIHADYLQAGADVLTTNTFRADRVALGRFGLAEQQAEILQAGARLAREVADEADRPVFVAGSVGPVPSHAKYGDELESMILAQIEGLIAGGVDFILFETQLSREALVHCASAMQRSSEIPYVLSFAVAEDGETVAGESIRRMVRPMAVEGPQPVAWGLNCGLGPNGLLGAVEEATRRTDLPLIAQPNAGVPKEVDHRKIFFCSPEYLTEYAKRYVAMGVSGVGGCCGTTPEHIRQVARAVKPLARAERSRPSVVWQPVDADGQEPLPLAKRSRLGHDLAKGRRIATVELVPPRGYDLSDILDKSLMLRKRGVSAVNLPDGPRASSRISPLITAERIVRQVQIEPILHFCSRDRNLIGIQADLLGCASCGIQNLLFVTGDPPKLGNYPDASGVFDTDSIGMVAVQAALNRGIDLGGQAIDPPTTAVIGVGLDPTAPDRQRELDRFRRKVEAGAEFAITQPVFDPVALLRFLDEIDDCGIPILAGIWPLASYRNALFLHNEVPGVEIPEDILERMRSVESREDQLETGIEIARQSVEAVADRVAGIQVSAPFGKVEIALEVIESRPG